MISFDFSQMVEHVNKIIAELPATLTRTMTSLAEITQTNAKSSTKFKNRTGKLRAGIKFRKLSGSPYDFRIESDQKYSYWIEHGNNQGGPYIYPKKAKALRFVIDGKVIFAKRVRSHGPYNVFKTARNFMRGFLPDLMVNDITRMIDRIR